MSVPGLPTPGQVYADVLWDTSLLPAFVADRGVQAPKGAGIPGGVVPASIPYIELAAIDRNPRDEEEFIVIVSNAISEYIYGVSFSAIGSVNGFDITKNTYAATGLLPSPTVGNNIPSRYIVMGGRVSTGQGLVNQQADQYQVTAVGQGVLLQTDWRSPPNYTQSNVV
jgi:hypothetical protein